MHIKNSNFRVPYIKQTTVNSFTAMKISLYFNITFLKNVGSHLEYYK